MAGPSDYADSAAGSTDVPGPPYADTSADDAAEWEAAKEAAAQRKRERAAARKASTDRVRTRVAQVVWIVSVVFALVLALGALCVALRANPDNALVSFLLKSADKLDFGVFSRTKDGVYHAVGNTHAAHTKNAIVNWGLAAVVWLVGGQIVSRIIKP
jgi:hypothetical protein